MIYISVFIITQIGKISFNLAEINSTNHALSPNLSHSFFLYFSLHYGFNYRCFSMISLHRLKQFDVFYNAITPSLLLVHQNKSFRETVFSFIYLSISESWICDIKKPPESSGAWFLDIIVDLKHQVYLLILTNLIL